MKECLFFKRVVLVVCLVLLVVLQGGCGTSADVDVSGDLLESAWQDYRLGEYKRAIATFDLVLAQEPEGSDRALQALYGLATTWNLRMPEPDQDRELAAELYRRVIDTAPDSDLAAWSMLGLARMKHLVRVGEEPDYDAVRAAYRELIEKRPEHIAAHEAFVYLQSTYVATMDPDDARQAERAVLDFVAKHPDSPFVSTCYSILSTCYEILGEPEKRLDAELKAFDTAEVDPSNPAQDNAWRYWMLAALAEFNVGDFDTARIYYKRLIEEYPTDIRVYSSEKALERMDRIEAEIRKELSGDS